MPRVSSDLAALRRRGTQRLAELELPASFATDVLVDRLATTRERPLLVIEWDLTDSPCGMWAEGERADYVFVDASASGLHREHIVAHELAHLMCGHGADTAMGAEHVAPLLATFDALGVEAVRRIFSRESYATPEEREAEVLASLVLQHADAGASDSRYDQRSGSWVPGPAEVEVAPNVERLVEVMGRRSRRAR